MNNEDDSEKPDVLTAHDAELIGEILRHLSAVRNSLVHEQSWSRRSWGDERLASAAVAVVNAFQDLEPVPQSIPEPAVLPLVVEVLNDCGTLTPIERTNLAADLMANPALLPCAGHDEPGNIRRLHGGHYVWGPSLDDVIYIYSVECVICQVSRRLGMDYEDEHQPAVLRISVVSESSRSSQSPPAGRLRLVDPVPEEPDGGDDNIVF